MATQTLEEEKDILYVCSLKYAKVPPANASRRELEAQIFQYQNKFEFFVKKNLCPNYVFPLIFGGLVNASGIISMSLARLKTRAGTW